jgi:hypothetical protein
VRTPVLIFASLLSVSLAAHALSVSYAQFTVEACAIHAVVRLPLDDVDLLLRLDRDLDGRVSTAELETSRDAVQAYLTKHLQIEPDGVASAATLGRLAVWRDAAAFEYLEADVTAVPAHAIRAVSIRSDFLTELYPAHRTQGQIRIRGRDEAFVFQSGTTYQRRIAPDRWTASLLVVFGAFVIGLLWFARRSGGRAVAGGGLIVLALANTLGADIIMSAAGLNATLKKLERLKHSVDRDPKPGRDEALFQIGVEADGLASLMNEEVASHGMQERELIDLALSRTKELGLAIAYNRDKKKFFYDGTAFRQYLESAPRGSHAAAAEFTLLSYQFYESTGTDPNAVAASADAKNRFLVRHPTFKANPELRLYLAIDYRDLYRHYREAGDRAAAEKYRRLTRAEYLRIAGLYGGTEQADTARRLLRRFDEETR